VPAQVSLRDALDESQRSDSVAADVAIVWRPPAAFFREQPRLRLVFNLGAGVDALLALPTLPRHVPLLRLQDAGMAGALAEYVLAAVLHAYRGLDVYARQQAAGQWQPRTPPPRGQWPVGVLGLGALGGAIARALHAHGFAVRGFARSAHAIDGVDCRAGGARDVHGEFGRFLDGLQALVSVLPLTADNAGVLDAAAWTRVARGAHVINVGRGQHIVEADLLAALDAGQLGGATLDVFAVEPLPADHPFWRHPRVRLTPHVSALTPMQPAVEQIAARLAAWRRGEPLTGVVDFSRGY
jgi:glyoxylate/hydroxypyruvate reductase